MTTGTAEISFDSNEFDILYFQFIIVANFLLRAAQAVSLSLARKSLDPSPALILQLGPCAHPFRRNRLRTLTKPVTAWTGMLSAPRNLRFSQFLGLKITCDNKMSTQAKG